jgi:hypothetical protein
MNEQDHSGPGPSFQEFLLLRGCVFLKAPLPQPTSHCHPGDYKPFSPDASDPRPSQTQYLWLLISIYQSHLSKAEGKYLPILALQTRENQGAKLQMLAAEAVLGAEQAAEAALVVEQAAEAALAVEQAAEAALGVEQAAEAALGAEQAAEAVLAVEQAAEAALVVEQAVAKLPIRQEVAENLAEVVVPEQLELLEQAAGVERA